MLRWCDQIRIGFCADRLIWIRIARGFRSRIVEKKIIEVKASESGAIWTAALKSLAEALKALENTRARVTVILSNRFVRYAVVPWHPALMKQSERQAQARHCFKEIYGEVAADWAVMISNSPYGRPTLATAVDGRLIANLDEAFKVARVPLISVQPYLTVAYQQFRSVIRKRADSTLYFGVVEQDDVGVLQFGRNGLEGVFNQRFTQDWQRVLRGVVMQAAGGGDNASICVFAPGRPQGQDMPGVKNAHLILPSRSGFSAVSDSLFSMGLAGLK